MEPKLPRQSCLCHSPLWERREILALVRLRGQAAGTVYWKCCASIIEMLSWLGNYGVRGSLGCLRLCTCILVAWKRTACIHYLLLYSYHRLSSCESWRNILVHQRRQWLCQRTFQILRGNEATRGCRATKEEDDGRDSQSHLFIVRKLLICSTVSLLCDQQV